MKVLFLTTSCPWPPAAGAAIRTSGWMHAVAARASIGIVTLTRGALEERGMSELAHTCAYARSVPAPRNAMRRARDVARALVGRIPYAIAVGSEKRLRRAVEDAIAVWAPDVVQADGIGAAPYLDLARASGIPTVYSAHNLEWRIAAGSPETLVSARAAGLFAPGAVERMRRAEKSVAARACAVVAVSEIEAEWFRGVARDVRCIPNAIDVARYAFVPPSSRRGGDIVFFGHLAYPPNVEAATRLVRRILPRIRRRFPGVRCVVAGRTPARALRRLAGDGVSVLADLDDGAEVWRRAAVLLCPVRWGGGSRLKLLEAAASGVPVASTRFSAEGLSLRPGLDYLVGESDEELAEEAEYLLGDSARADELAKSAAATVAVEHDWRRWAGRILELYEHLAGHHG